MTQKDFFNARSTFDTGSGRATLYRLNALAGGVERLPFSIKILLEALLRQVDPFDELAFLGLECDIAGAAWIDRASWALWLFIGPMNVYWAIIILVRYRRSQQP